MQPECGKLKAKNVSEFRSFFYSDCVSMFLPNTKLFNIVFARLAIIYGCQTMQEDFVWEGKGFYYRRSENIFGNLKTRLLQFI